MKTQGAALLLLTALAVGAGPALAASHKKAPAKAPAAAAAPATPKTAAFPKGQYRTLDGLPDWGGVWILTFPRRSPPAGGPPQPPTPRPVPQLKGKYLEDYQAYRKATAANGGVAPKGASNCMPPGMPGIMAVGQYPMQYLFTPGQVTILQEAWGQWRRIFTDGRPHPEDPEPSFQGNSVGHWDGDTLVVDTTAIKEDVALQLGMRHSDKLHIIERLHLSPTDKDSLIDEITLDDPEALEAPFHLTQTYHRTRDGDLIEFICAENDRNPVDDKGVTRFEGIAK
jgi:hypothetical protein